MKKYVLLILAALVLFVGCEDDEKKYHYVKFTVDYTPKEFGYDEEIGGFENNSCIWFEDKDDYEGDYITISLPSTVAVGDTFTQGESGFSFEYKDEDTDTYYEDKTSSFSLTVTKWEGSGGSAEGTFSGTLDRNLGSGDATITLTDGTFECNIE